MKMKLSTRLTLSYLVVILIGMGIIAPLAWLAMEQLYLNSQANNLLAQAQLVASALGTQPLSGGLTPYTQASNTIPGIHTRIIDPEGGAVIELSATGQAQANLALPKLANNASGIVTQDELFSRPEISKALQGQAATQTRRLDLAGGKRILYAAVPVFASDGGVSQIIYLATPLPDTSLGALPSELRWQFLAVLLVALLISAAAGFVLAYSISTPLSRLARAAQGVAEGDLAQTVPESSSIHELTILGKTFNFMTESLRQSDQAKTAFISDVTHELRTPLTVIKGTVETLEDGAIDDLDARGQFLSSLHRETDRLIRLVNDLLVLTRADAGALNLHFQSLDLLALARERCNQLDLHARQRNINLIVTEEMPLSQRPAKFLIRGDTDRLAQILDNLIDNAIRYAPPASTITVSLSRTNMEISCRVTDCGEGIPAKHIPLIFERFYRADSGRDRAQGGAGLGLAIVRSLVQAHGGRVSVESVEGQGATFSVCFPALD